MQSKKLNLNYNRLKDGSILFEDQVRYTREEMDKIMNLEPDELKAIHIVKKIFKGEIIA